MTQTPMPRVTTAATLDGTLLSVAGLTFLYPQRAVFTDWSARIDPGVTLLLGGEGSGKTTLLRLLAGELRAASGSVLLKGVRQSEPSQAYRAQVFWQHPATDALDAITALHYFEQLRGRYPAFLPPDAAALQALLVGLSLTST
jgi:ABC-type multidrug transport system ATPase subunit